LNSVTIKSIDREQITEAVKTFAGQLREQHSQIQRIIWFGSWVSGLPSPGSDVDICLILASSDKSPRDRISDYLPLGFPVGIDLFAYTQEEFDQLPYKSPGWYEAIMSGIEI
jgi:hypothetical protein